MADEKDALAQRDGSKDTVRDTVALVGADSNGTQTQGDMSPVSSLSRHPEPCPHNCRYWENDFLGCPEHDR
jgi:hypothetical protein